MADCTHSILPIQMASGSICVVHNSSIFKQHRVSPCNQSIAITALIVLQAIMVERKEDKPAGAAAGGGGMPGGFGPGGMPAGLTM